VISNAQPKTLQKEVLQLFALPRHPNLVEFLGVTETGWPMLEHVLGGELFHAIDNKTLPDSKKYSIAQELANALAAIHRNRQIHSDIKSDNVLLTEDFNAKITDFGYAVFRKEDLPKHTFGTPCYAPPELILYPGRPKDASIDTWCYGYLIFFMLSETLFYDALFHSCYRKYPQHEYGWTVKQVDLFLREEDYRMDAKITETLNTLEHTLQASSLSPDQARTLVSVMRLCLKFKAQERAPMETIEALFAATTIK
jgi:serine/threonine protein kinase